MDGTIVANPSILFDALFIPGGAGSIRALQENGDAVHYALESYIHYKTIAAAGQGVDFLAHIGLISRLKNRDLPAGILTSASNNISDDFKQQIVKAIGQHRFFYRERVKAIPA